jgi:hypothetical protein
MTAGAYTSPIQLCGQLQAACEQNLIGGGQKPDLACVALSAVLSGLLILLKMPALIQIVCFGFKTACMELISR